MKDNSLKITGFANYIYDFENEVVIHEYLELTKGNYRLTDQRLIKPTDHYLSKHVKRIRDNILDPITNHQAKDISKITFNELNETQIKQINDYLKLETTTIKNQFSYFQGSNISGAKTNSKASPIVCMEQQYSGCNFANPMKLIRGKENLNYQIIKDISLVELIEDNENFMNIFKEYNAWYFNDLLVDNSKIKLSLQNEKLYSEHNIESWVYPNDLDDKISNYIDAHLNDTWKDNDINIHKRMLRTFFGSAVKRELNNKKLPFCASKVQYNSSVIENAHIINFSKLVEINSKESILKAINPFNVLRINSDNHKLFDRHIITFDPQGNIIMNNEIIEESFLDIINLPEETIHFLEENYKYWKQNKCNK